MSKTIYLDRHQCNRFNLPYFDNGAGTLAAHSILESKLQGYDDYHKNILNPISKKVGIVKISREREDSPGWYKIMDHT